MNFKCEVTAPPPSAAYYTLTWYLATVSAKVTALPVGTKVKDIASTEINNDIYGKKVWNFPVVFLLLEKSINMEISSLSALFLPIEPKNC